MTASLTSAEYQLLVEQAPLLIWRSDARGGCDYFNDRWLAFTGRTTEQELGDGWAGGVHPDDLAGALATYRQSFEARRAFEMEYRLRRHDGEFRWLFDRGVPFFSPGGTFGGFIGSCVDVTERVESQAAREASRVAEIRVLQGLLPICAHCKRIRDDRGYWQGVEAYVEGNSAATFTHTLCPPCLDRHYPG